MNILSTKYSFDDIVNVVENVTGCSVNNISGDLDVKLYDKEEEYQSSVRRKIRTYHCHIQIGLIAQGLLQYLSCIHSDVIWRSFGSWLRTIRSNIPPSEMVTSMALKNMLPKFLLDNTEYSNLKKFIAEKLDLEHSEGMRLAA